MHSPSLLTVVRLALQYGFNALDTSHYYYPSEILLGRVLGVLAPAHPRSTYYISTKVGRYGPALEDFDYATERVRRSVEQSCTRLGTEYIDVVLMHDVEFVAEQVGESNAAGWTARDVVSADAGVREAARESVGLSRKDAGKIHGAGDQAVLDAVAELFRLKEQGKIRNVGISGYPLPVLVRLSWLVHSRLGKPLDVILSYSNRTLHSDILPQYLELFKADPSVPDSERASWTGPTILNGSAFSMGLLTDVEPPAWHPASDQLKLACKEASSKLRERGSSLAKVALTYGIRGAELQGSRQGTALLRTLNGMSTVDHVHAAVQAWRVLAAGASESSGGGKAEADTTAALTHASRRTTPVRAEPLVRHSDSDALRQYEAQVQEEEFVLKLLQKSETQDLSWSSP